MIRSILAILLLSSSVCAYSMDEWSDTESVVSSIESSVAFQMSGSQKLGLAGAAAVGTYVGYKANSYFESKCSTEENKGSKKCVAWREAKRFAKIVVPVGLVAAGQPIYKYELTGDNANDAIQDGLTIGLAVYGLDAGWRLTKFVWNKVCITTITFAYQRQL